jgi:hypothetical protein
MYDLEEFERPETRFLAPDADVVNNTKSLEEARRVSVFPSVNNPQGPDTLTGPFALLGKEETLG